MKHAKSIVLQLAHDLSPEGEFPGFDSVTHLVATVKLQDGRDAQLTMTLQTEPTEFLDEDSGKRVELIDLR